MLTAYRHHNRLTPAAPPLLAFLFGCIPVVYGLGWPGLFAGLLLLALLCCLETRLRAAILSSVFVFAVCRSAWVASNRHNSFAAFLPRGDCHGALVCMLDDSPREIGSDIRFAATVSSVSFGDTRRDCGGIIQVEIPSEIFVSLSPSPDSGDILELDGCFLGIDGTSSGYSRHLRSLGLSHTFVASAVQAVRPCSGWRLWLRHFHGLRTYLGNHLAAGMPELTGNLYQSMVLGRKDLFPSETRRQFIRAATLHIFAISGLHVNVLHAVLLCLLGRLGLRRVAVHLACVALSGLYVLLTGVTPSSLRALVMVVLTSAASLKSRGANSRNSLLLAALAELSWNPLWLYNTGFLFSFCVVLALIYSAPLLSHVQDILFEARRWRLSRRNSPWPPVLLNAGGSMTFAWLSSTPIAMHLNGILPMGALAVGLATQLVAEWLVQFAIPKTAADVICPAASGLLGRAADTMMSFLLFMADIGGSPGMYLLRKPISGTAAAVMMAAVFALAAGWRFRWLRRPAAAVILGWLILAVLPRRCPRLLVATGTDGGIPAACVVSAEGDARLVCCGGRSSACRLRDGLVKLGLEDIAYLPAFPMEDQPASAELIARTLPPHVIAIPPDTRTGALRRLRESLCQRIHTHLLQKSGKSIWQAQYAGLHLRQKSNGDGFNATYRHNADWVSMQMLPGGQCVVMASLDGQACLQVLPPTAKPKAIFLPDTE